MRGKFIDHVKNRLRKYRLYILAREVKEGLKRGLKEIDRPDRKVISLQPEKPSQGNVLLSYIIDPFLLKPEQPLPNTHTHYWESSQMARTWLDLGYGVDVISWQNMEFVPQKDYAFFIDVRRNLERLAPLLNKDCVKILHSDIAHILFHNAAESRRLLELQQRRGITLRPRRFEVPNWAIEHADCAIIKGNEFTLNTYRYANKPLYRIRTSTLALYPWPEEKDFDACRKRFLWLSSGGMVHKGLDLVLDAFAEMPEYHVTICGPVQREKDFEQAFYRELYQTPNIRTIGWVDISSPEFINITNHCLGLIYPSCSEGQSGSVVTCLHAGLIPIVSYESGVDVDDFGVILRSCSIDEIKDSIRMVSGLSAPELRRRARKAWEFARENHTRERFAQEYHRIVTEIINTYRK